MGLAGGLVRRVFSKSRSSAATHHGNKRNFGAAKSRWNSVRLYICGDELDSHVEDGSASSKGSEATIMQPEAEGSGEETSSANKPGEEFDELPMKQEENSPARSFLRENAATHIQSAFRGFLARQLYERIRQSAKIENAGTVSEANSTEVQIGDSTEILRAEGESITVQHRVLHKSQSQVCRLKEDWDDSTVDSNISKLRIQNRLEATTRRERALAYAFSQQLRICSTKRKFAGSGPAESNMGWSWLERWMATRMLENSFVEDCLSKHPEPINVKRRSVILRKRFDVAVEEKESCGSNDVSVNFDGFSTPSETPRDGFGPVRNRLKVAQNASQRRSLPEYNSMTRSKVSKRVSLREAEKAKRCKQEQQKSVEEIENEVFPNQHETDITCVNNCERI